MAVGIVSGLSHGTSDIHLPRIGGGFPIDVGVAVLAATAIVVSSTRASLRV